MVRLRGKGFDVLRGSEGYEIFVGNCRLWINPHEGVRMYNESGILLLEVVDCEVGFVSDADVSRIVSFSDGRVLIYFYDGTGIEVTSGAVKINDGHNWCQLVMDK